MTRRAAPRAVATGRVWGRAMLALGFVALGASFASLPGSAAAQTGGLGERPGDAGSQSPVPAPDPVPAPPRPTTRRPIPEANDVPEGVLIQSYTVPMPGRAQRVVEPLPMAVALRLQHAMDLRASGLVARARDTLLVLLRAYPHHPLIVTELGRTQLAREDWFAVERLAVAERAAARDSALLGRELAEAYERLGRPREALRTAIEAWTVSPADGQWASATVFKLAPLDARGSASALEAVTKPRPWRTDLALGLARLYAVSGRPTDAVRVLADTEERSGRGGLRTLFADDALRAGSPADTTAALAVLLSLAGDDSRGADERLAAARRAWAAAQASGREAEWAPRLAQALRAVPAERWGPEFLLGLVRALQRSGHPAEARALLAANPELERRMPELTLERALGLAREGSLERALPLLDSLTQAWPQARFMLAEAQFFAGELDSAQSNYERIAAHPEDADAAVALDRLYLLEDSPGSPVRATLGKLAFERWRGHRAAAALIADSLWRSQAPRGDYAARVGLELASLRMEANDPRGALAALMVVCDSLSDDRLAPLARQRAGDAYAALGDDKNALAQYEECLARYPRAWNSPEVRRRVERLRKETRL